MNRLAMSFTILALLTAPAWAAGPFKLKTQISISSATVSLADLLDHTVTQALPDMPLFASPDPGESGLINAERIRMAAERAGLSVEKSSTPQSVVVTRIGRILDQQTLMNELAELIAHAHQTESKNVTLTRESWPRMITIETESHAPVEFRNLALDLSQTRYEADLFIADSPSLSRHVIHINGRFEISTLCITAQRAMKKGEIISAADLVTEKCLLKNKTHEPMKPERLIGLALIDDVNAGTLLGSQLVTKPMLVEKGTPVILSYTVGGLVLTLRGRANEAGALGDMVSITHNQSKKPIDGIVTGRGSVSVNSLSRAALARNENPPSSEQVPSP